MILYPAIDLMNGKAVRLRQGRREDVTVYGEPVEIAARYWAEGAEWLHLVDLEAAFDGATRALPLIRRITEAFSGPVELGGGLRTEADIEARFDCGVSRCIIGTAAFEHPELVEAAARRHPGQIAVGIDAKNGRVALRGWVETAPVSAIALARQMKEKGVSDLIYTDISRDGMLTGPNVPAMREMIAETGMRVIASGGVSSLEDLRQLKKAGCAGAILGKALYEGAFSLSEAIRLTGEE